MAQTLQTAWAYIWACMNTGIHMRVHVHVQLRMSLQGPQSLAHSVVTLFILQIKGQGWLKI